MKVRFVSSVPAMIYDQRHGRLVKVVRKIDTKGREWEEYSADNEPPLVYLIEAPEEPVAKRTQRHGDGTGKK